MKALFAASAIIGGAMAFAGAAFAEPVADGGRKFTTPMSGAEECNTSVTPTVCGVGDPDGSATGSITVNVGQDRVCWEFTNVTNVAPVNRGQQNKEAIVDRPVNEPRDHRLAPRRSAVDLRLASESIRN